jgi:hypothetical protein
VIYEINKINKLIQKEKEAVLLSKNNVLQDKELESSLIKKEYNRMYQITGNEYYKYKEVSYDITEKYENKSIPFNNEDETENRRLFLIQLIELCTVNNLVKKKSELNEELKFVNGDIDSIVNYKANLLNVISEEKSEYNNKLLEAYFLYNNLNINERFIEPDKLYQEYLIPLINDKFIKLDAKNIYKIGSSLMELFITDISNNNYTNEIFSKKKEIETVEKKLQKFNIWKLINKILAISLTTIDESLYKYVLPKITIYITEREKEIQNYIRENGE